ncbi:MAG: glycosyltransferase family 1 protein [Chloroflexota bacterium]
MLIGIDASPAARHAVTGTERYCIEITRALIRAAPDDRFVLYFSQEPPDGLFPRDSRVHWRVMPFPRLWSLGRLSLEVNLRPPDVLFVPSHSLPIALRCPTVNTVHDLGYLRFPAEHGRARRWVRDWMTRWSVARATALIAVSAATRDDMVRYYDTAPDRVRVIHHGVATQFSPDCPTGSNSEALLHLGVKRPYFLFLGTLQPRKNLDSVLAAFDLFCDRGSHPHRLVLAGATGWQSDRLYRSLARVRARDRVVCTGYVPQALVPALLRGASALCFPSLFEGFGLPALEAMACGAPVIASHTSALPEVVGDAGLLVDPLDVESIALGLQRLAAEPGLAADLRARGLLRASTFSWERAATETLRVLRLAAGTT